MRIAFLVNRFPKLSETFILDQVTGLLDAGEEVDIYASRPGRIGTVPEEVFRHGLSERTRYLASPGGRLRSVGTLLADGRLLMRPQMLRGALQARHRGSEGSLLGLLWAGREFLDGGAYDIIHCQFGHLGFGALTLRRMGIAQGKLVVSFRGSDLTRSEHSRDYEPLFRAADLLLPVCEWFAQKLVARGCPSEKVQVHRSGIPLARFEFRPRARAADEPTSILSVARLTEKKGIAYAVEAIARVRASGRKVRYTVVGDGVLLPSLERAVHEAGLGNVVSLVGPMTRDDVVHLLEKAHIVLAPSVTASDGDQEGIPNVLKEAMAVGLPVISTWHSGIPELVQDGVSGFLVPEANSEALAKRLSHLIDHPERWPEMGRAGRAQVEAAYDACVLNRRLIELYRGILQRPGPTVRTRG